MNKTSVDKGQRGLTLTKVVKKEDFLAFFTGMNEISSIVLIEMSTECGRRRDLGKMWVKFRYLLA